MLEVIHELQKRGLILGGHEPMNASRDAKPSDFGCVDTEISIELETLFKHPRY